MPTAAARVRIDRAPAHKLHPFEGFGAQFNANIFRPMTFFADPKVAKEEGQPRVLTPGQHDALRARIGDMKPGHSRVFIHRELINVAEPPARELDALMQTLRLAQDAGATVNATFWGQDLFAAKARLEELRWPEPTVRNWPRTKELQKKYKWPEKLMSGTLLAPGELMSRFAHILHEVRRQGVTCVTQATIQNEPNGPSTDLAMQGKPVLSMRFYEWLYRLLDKELAKLKDPLDPSRTLRQTVKLVGGDLVSRGNAPQNEWLSYVHDHMDVPRPQFRRVVDAYSIHVYWDSGGGPTGFPQKLEQRIEALPKILKARGIDRPLYVTEYGVKVDGTHRPEPGGPGSGQRIEFSPDVAFQHAWFNALAPQCGCAGLAKWVLYRTDNPAHFGEWGMIDAPNPPGPRTSFGRSPAYRMTRLFNHLVDPGWKAAGLGRDGSRMLMASKFAGGKHESVAVLNRGAGSRQVLVEGLKPRTDYFAAVWNRDGNGVTKLLPNPVKSSAAGAAPVEVPRHGVVALSTRPLRL